MKISFRQRGDFSRLQKYLSKSIDAVTLEHLRRYGEQGVQELKAATPVDTGKTATSWSYEIKKENSVYSLEFHNSNVVDGWFNVAIMLDVGHGTGNGGWVEGLNYIDPIVQPIFEKMAHDLWLEVVSL
jgi:hypothetical protein